MVTAKPFDNVLRIGAIVVIESLGPRDLRTGTRLFEGLLEPAQRAKGFPQSFLFTPNDANGLSMALRRTAEEVERSGVKPLIHLEAHGDETGVQLASGEHVSWENLRQPLTRVNRAARLGLTVAMAACRGWHLTKALLPDQAAPAFAIVGPADDIVAGDLHDAFHGFYACLLYGAGGEAALSALNAHLPADKPAFSFEFAADMFCKGFRRYHQQFCTPQMARERENALVAELVRRRGLDLLQSAEAREAARAILADQRAFFEHAKELFFMYEFQENRERFPLPFDYCA